MKFNDEHISQQAVSVIPKQGRQSTAPPPLICLQLKQTDWFCPLLEGFWFECTSFPHMALVTTWLSPNPEPSIISWDVPKVPRPHPALSCGGAPPHGCWLLLFGLGSRGNLDVVDGCGYCVQESLPRRFLVWCSLIPLSFSLSLFFNSLGLF